MSSSETQLMKLLLSHDFYEDTKNKLRGSMFDSPFMEPVYNSLVAAHAKYEKDLTAVELEELTLAANPTMTTAQKSNVLRVL